MNEFGNFLYTLRKEKGYTQAELAEMLGVTNKAVSKWETGEAFPETAQLIPLADIFGVTADELLRGRASEEKNEETATAPEPRAYRKERSKAEEIAEKYQPDWWHKKFAVLIVCGFASIAAGVIALIAAGLVSENENTYLLFTAILLAFIGLGVDLFMYAGITSQNAFLPIRDENWKKKLVSFRTQMIAGMSCCFLGVIGILSAGFFGEGAFWESKTALILAVLFGFIFIAVGVFFFIYGVIVWESYRKKIVSAKREADGKAALSPEEREALGAIDKKENNNSLSGRISSVIMLLATVIFLLLGFLKELWHPGWVVFPVGGILCAIVSIIFRDKN